ncbi:MAG: anaerobic ribonucleoside-triphosphate reductase activating protein [Campylobacteraceae bacterium]|nr:anaerobic ribonucleoside-triphosphate reductase activating protein [Campylobacteraceae bacterium]
MYKEILADKPLYGITKFTTLDFPQNLASIFWFCKCNMRCPYCYNAPIVFGDGSIDLKTALDFLKTRQNKLTGVVLSGGECTLYPNLKAFCKEIKNLNFKIKIDTNGTNPKLVKELVCEKLIDYIALDYKAPLKKFQNITQNKNFDDFEKTLNYLINTNFPFEVRTTVHTGLLDIEDINLIIDDLCERGYKNSYYLQNFLYVKDTIGEMPAQTHILDTSKINKKIDVNLREF